MIRTGYLRWEIEVEDTRSAVDRDAREIVFLARPSYRRVVVRGRAHQEAVERFVRGEAGYGELLRRARSDRAETELTIPDVGPRRFRYSESDRAERLRYWMEKVQREASAFAHEVVRVASGFPQLVIANPSVRAGYARLVEAEIHRVIEGRSQPAATNQNEPMRVDVSADLTGVPELVAAELVRDVVEPKEFAEFCTYDRVTITHGGLHYRIPRRTHGLIEVWDAQTLRGVARLCVVFQDPGMPPSDEVVMKYLLAKHNPDLLWQLGVRFTAPTGRFDGAPPRRMGWSPRS
ncbi:MAG: hypothetical protein KatS3mg108_2656 [Isosphaeraceae bacterium]|jgi:hypothetical protein|nr:MAG: hypothetical protein KatS3mg108_2656 [Isosphaeraceae bacterium]